MRALTLIASCGLIALLGTACEVGREDDTGLATQQVQTDYEGYWEIVRDDSTQMQARSTGAIRIQDGDILASCGATFLSPQYAVTAAHCVDSYTTSESFTIEQIDASGVTDTHLDDQAEVSGNWPNFERGSTLSSGYSVTSYSCTVVRRCHPDYGGTYRCPSGVPSSTDVALVQCGDRPTTAGWVAAPFSIEENGRDIDVWWFHELLDMPTYDDNTQYWDHYGALTADKEQNYHYTESHQLLPLLSETDRYNQQYQARARYDGDRYVNANVPVCHGTSGSGTFEHGTTALYGPVVHGGSYMSGRLCTQMTSVGTGTDAMGFVSSAVTSIFSNLSEVVDDR